MKGIKILAVIFAVLIGSVANAATMDVAWTSPTTRTDGTALLPTDIATFRVYYGTATGVYGSQVDVNDGTAVSTSIGLLPGGTYFVVMSVIDTLGQESIMATEATITLGTAPPKTVTGLTVTVGVSPTP